MKPTVTIPAGPAPTSLAVDDLVVGDGAEAAPGKPISVQYVGVSYSNGKEFDSSWNSGSPFDFTLGAGKVIAGWDEGIVGMKVGGRRQLTIPADKAYGAQGFPPVIAPGETLVFVVDLLRVG
ncbi:MAG TPA: FKBP-type peptidyl-prolyl cis-trans isomerase [Mycobacteriales bacterium]|nr:FKBP-type peptidyl-prolyl cis-trans isomerase [Mycobacteriales bacterium]